MPPKHAPKRLAPPTPLERCLRNPTLPSVQKARLRAPCTRRQRCEPGRRRYERTNGNVRTPGAPDSFRPDALRSLDRCELGERARPGRVERQRCAPTVVAFANRQMGHRLAIRTENMKNKPTSKCQRSSRSSCHYCCARIALLQVEHVG